MIGARRGDRGEIILGDVITHIEGKPVTSNDEFLTAMEQHRVGDTIAVTTQRFGEQKRFNVELSNAQ
jgi:S1-C subfamily serine protease